MDYEVFMLSRMREAYDETGSTNKAIELGLARTGKLVTSADRRRELVDAEVDEHRAPHPAP